MVAERGDPENRAMERYKGPRNGSEVLGAAYSKIVVPVLEGPFGFLAGLMARVQSVSREARARVGNLFEIDINDFGKASDSFEELDALFEYMGGRWVNRGRLPSDRELLEWAGKVTVLLEKIERYILQIPDKLAEVGDVAGDPDRIVGEKTRRIQEELSLKYLVFCQIVVDLNKLREQRPVHKRSLHGLPWDVDTEDPKYSVGFVQGLVAKALDGTTTTIGEGARVLGFLSDKGVELEVAVLRGMAAVTVSVVNGTGKAVSEVIGGLSDASNLMEGLWRGSTMLGFVAVSAAGQAFAGLRDLILRNGNGNGKKPRPSSIR